jgi:hypothetical protein
MAILIIRSWLLLCLFDLRMMQRDPSAVEKAVQKQPIRSRTGALPCELICRAMDYACVLYFKKAWCRQRSAATTILLRQCGWEAKMATGVQILPFRSHAWVEVQGRIVNDKPYMHDMYQVLDWC